jgi:hypothetical protein
MIQVIMAEIACPVFTISQAPSLALTDIFLYFDPITIWSHCSTKMRSVSLVLGVCHHKVVCDDQDKYEDAQEVGEETQVLIVKHLQQSLQTKVR